MSCADCRSRHLPSLDPRVKALVASLQERQASLDAYKRRIYGERDREVAELEKTEEARKKQGEELKKQEEESKKKEERLKEREREMEAEKERRDEQERDAAVRAGNGFSMTANFADRAQGRQSPDAEPTGGMDMDTDMDMEMDFGDNPAQLSPPQAFGQLGDTPPLYQALPFVNTDDTGASRVPKASEEEATTSASRSNSRVIDSSSASTNTVQASKETSAHAIDKQNVPPSSPIRASLATALLGQKRPAGEVEEEENQEGTNKRSRLVDDSTQNAELDSAISIITAAIASEPTAASQSTSTTSPADDSAATSLDNLSQQEVASIRALLGPKRSESQSPAVSKRRGEE